MKRIAAALLPALLISGCGYALVGRGVMTDPSIKKIGVPPFRDTTGKAGLHQKITAAVTQELLKRGRFEVVSDTKEVDAVVDGELVAYRVTPVGYSQVGGPTPAPGAAVTTEASRYDITLSAKVKYAKVGAEEPIWSNESFLFRDEYDLGSAEGGGLFDREDQAIDRLSEDFARSLVAAMLEAF
jgi:hypothetical protein